MKTPGASIGIPTGAAADMKKELSREQWETSIIKQEAEERMQSGEAMINKAAAVERELAEAKAKIRRLTEKPGRRKRKAIGGFPWSA